MRRRIFVPLWVALFLVAGVAHGHAAEAEATALVEKAYNYMRGMTSVSTLVMTIHNPHFERSYTIKAWTKGVDDSLFLVTAPPKDAGNGTLKLKHEMWTYNPKISRTIKLPPSMMSQSWMGSDFSNNDLSKSDSILTDYDHTMESSETVGDKKVYVIKLIPKPDAPVVWGMLKMTIREDLILLKQEFFDEDLETVKVLSTEDIQMAGDKPFPMKWSIRPTDKKDKYTELEYLDIAFDKELPSRLFTLTSLKNAGR